MHPFIHALFRCRSTLLTGALATALVLIPASAAAIGVDLLMEDSGEKAGSHLGTSVSAAGDFNGDGYDDVIAGANTAGGDGRAYVYFGGPGADAVPDVTLDQGLSLAGFGSSVGSADVNGDGYDDVFVGAPSADVPLSNNGAVYVYFGGAAPDSIPDMTLPGLAAIELIGTSVGSAGDVNDDGYPDIIAGGRGVARLYYGGAAPDTIADLTFLGVNANDRFGRSVSTARDFNGDGYDDVIIGTDALSAASDNRGLAYLYFGGAAMDTTAEFVFHGEAAEDHFGVSVGSGDFNGDGYGDVIVGAYAYDAFGVADVGRAYIFLGGPGADTIPDVTMTGQSAGDWFGFAVGGAGDLNRDGSEDFLVGAKFNDGGGADAGQMFFYYGSPGVDSIPELVLIGDAAGDNFGSSVAAAGDFDGDGSKDVIVGASLSVSGKIYVYDIFPFRVLYPNGSETWFVGDADTITWKGSDQADLEISYDGGSSWNLLAGSTGGNLVNDYPLAVPNMPTETALVRVTYAGQGATSQTSDASDSFFRIVTPYVPPEAGCAPVLSMAEGNAGDYFGFSLAGMGNFNGDGYDDLIVGAYRNDAAGMNAGRAYIYFGGAPLDTVPDLVLPGEEPGIEFGRAVGSAGDFNGDGYADAIVGAYASNAGAELGGRAYLYLGGATPDSVADGVMTGLQPVGYLGAAVGTAGDVNGDGYDDVIVGAYGSTGWAYLYLGGAVVDTTADLILNGEELLDNFGYAVGTAGDFNGDGYDDMIVGAYRAASMRGRAYIYHGGPGMDSAPDLILEGEVEGDNLGIAVAGAGDVNGDGYDDVIVGASSSNAGGFRAGRAYVFFGGAPADSLPDLVYTGSANWNLGRSVGTAGDVNQDGYADLLVGAPEFSAGPPSEGQAFLYYGGPGADSVPDRTWTGTVPDGWLGWAVDGAGDMNGDGIQDIALGRGLIDGVFIHGCGLALVGTRVPPEVRNTFTLVPLFPNPVRSGRALQAAVVLPAGDTVVASLFDVQGRRLVSTEPQRFNDAGEHRMSLNPGPLPAGVYYFEVRTHSGMRASRSVVVLR